VCVHIADMCAADIYQYTHTYIDIYAADLYLYTCISIHTCIDMRVCFCVYLCVRAHVCVCICATQKPSNLQSGQKA